MVMTAEKEDGGKKELLILKDTLIDGKRVKRGEVVPYPKKNGTLLTGSANKAVVKTKESVAAFEADEKRRKARREAIAQVQAGTPKKPPKN